MRKVKLVFWLILLALLGLVFWQNQAFFLEKKGVEIDYFVGNYHLPALQIALYFLIFFLVGLLISYFSSLSERFVARKTIRKLNGELTDAGKRIADLEARLESRKGDDIKARQASTEEMANISESSAT